jgi:hypothetical protein
MALAFDAILLTTPSPVESPWAVETAACNSAANRVPPGGG